jgi:hypothetical protein
MITIYASFENKRRLTFVAEHLLEHVLGASFCITSDPVFYRKQAAPCINYSPEALEHGLQMVPHGLLSETGVQPHRDLQTAEWEGLFCFFYSGRGDVPFDMFAASFYLLSLYEEYGSTQLDVHHRFDHHHALLFRHQQLEVPLVDRWAYRLKAALEKTGGTADVFRLRSYRAIDTYDIDHPFRYRYKGFIKNGGGWLRDVGRRDFVAAGQRVAVLLHRSEDPYMQALQWIRETQQKAQRPYYLFVLLGDEGRYGRGITHCPTDYYRYLREWNDGCIGLHPSYRTSQATRPLTEALVEEKQLLEEIVQRPVTVSRQHFLQMQVPDTFRALCQANICEDFTLAFAQAPGFRSGTAIPHDFYDLYRERQTGLLLRPTVMMDATLMVHLQLSPSRALEKIRMLIDACRQSGGDYVSLWHNSNLAGSPEKNPWIDVYLESHRYASSMENH